MKVIINPVAMSPASELNTAFFFKNRMHDITTRIGNSAVKANHEFNVFYLLCSTFSKEIPKVGTSTSEVPIRVALFDAFRSQVLL